MTCEEEGGRQKYHEELADPDGKSADEKDLGRGMREDK